MSFSWSLIYLCELLITGFVSAPNKGAQCILYSPVCVGPRRKPRRQFFFLK